MYRFLVNLCLVALHMNSNAVGATPVDGEILSDSRKLLLFDMPLSCEGESYCFDKDDNYPESYIENLLDKLVMLPFNERIAQPIGDRNSPSLSKGSDNLDCPTNKTFADKPIYYILDEKDKVRAVVQSPQKFQQIYSAKWCERPGQIYYDTPNFLKGSQTLVKFKIECENTYMAFDFFVLTDKGLIEIARPKGGIPVCCRCKYSVADAD